MKRHGKHIMKIALVISLLILNSSFGIAGTKKNGEAVVKIKNNANVISVAEEIDAIVADSIPSKKIYLFKYSKDRSVEEVVSLLNENQNVELASENSTIGLPEVFQISQGFPDESVPIFNKGESPKHYYYQGGTYDIGIDSAHIFSTGAGVVVAVIDNGLDYSHPLIQQANILNGHDFISQGPDASEEPGSIYGHGTFVAGMLLLTAPDISILPLRVFDGDGIGDQFNVVKAIDWAIRQNVQIINMSFGTDEMIDILKDAIDDAIDEGIILVAAAGNDGNSNIAFPSAHPDVIAVASVDTLELLADFSNYGEEIDVVAPGVNLYSSLAGEYNWGTWSGTSFSTPIVSGTVALMLQIDHNLTPLEVQNHIRYTSRTDLLWGSIMAPELQYGYGIINSYKAVTQLSIADLNGSGVRDVSDLTLMVDYITNRDNNNINSAKYEERTGFVVTDELVDINCDGKADMSDVSLLVHHIFVNWREFKPCYMSKHSPK